MQAESASARAFIKSFFELKLSKSKKLNLSELLFCSVFLLIFKSPEITLKVEASACLNFSLKLALLFIAHLNLYIYQGLW